MSRIQSDMTLIEQFLRVADAYAAPESMSDAKLSMTLFNDWKRIGLLRGGRDQSTKSHEKRVQFMSDTWPDGAKWPEDVPRPAPRAHRPDLAQQSDVAA